MLHQPLCALAVASVQPGYGNTAPMQIELDPGISRSSEDIDNVAALIRTHFDLGGTQINMNILDKKATPRGPRRSLSAPRSRRAGNGLQCLFRKPLTRDAPDGCGPHPVTGLTTERLCLSLPDNGFSPTSGTIAPPGRWFPRSFPTLRSSRRASETLHLPASDDEVANEITLARELDYEPMFMTDCSGLIFDWKIDPQRSGPEGIVKTIQTRKGEWSYRAAREDIPWHDDAGCPVRTVEDHALLVSVCEEVGDRSDAIREYFRSWRARVGEDGVLVIGHPHPSWLGYQIAPSSVFYHWNDSARCLPASMEAVVEASLFVMSIAMEEGVDFMSDSSYGLEMTSPELFRTMDLPWIQKFSAWTHERGGLFWYHNCGFTTQG